MKNFFLISFNLLICVFIITCTNKAKQEDMMKNSPEELKEYQGVKLSSASDFYENSIQGPQHIDKEKYKLTIDGLVLNPKEYTYDQVIERQKYQRVVTLNCVEGWSVNILWEGIPVRDLLKEAGVGPKAKIIIFYAHDGYSTSFPLNCIMDNDIIMAYKMNGLPLLPERGFPFELVAEKKWGYKWIKWITRIELSDNQAFRGYWESRGYSNDGDLDKGFFDEP
ncbi:MAG: molybdopterin-dependent oxidoreductase [Candidatus Zixiibacteriota bacterium]